jgi:hypothetical protein
MFEPRWNVGVDTGAESAGGDATSAALAVLSGMVEDGRKAALMLSPEEIWTCSDDTVDALLVMHAQLESAAAALGHLIVRDADVRGLATRAERPRPPPGSHGN